MENKIENEILFVRLDRKLKEKFHNMADYKGLTMASLARSYIIERLRDDERKRNKECD